MMIDSSHGAAYGAEEIVMTGKFSTRELLLEIKLTRKQKMNLAAVHADFNAALVGVLGCIRYAGYLEYNIFMPSACDVFDLHAELHLEFAKYASLSGMRFKIDINSNIGRV